MKLPFLLLMLLAFSCRTPQERLNRLVKNHPELISVKEIEIRDTFITPGKSDSVRTKLIFKKVTLKVDSAFTLRFDSIGNVIPDSFKIKQKDVAITIYVDSLGIRINSLITKKILESQKIEVGNKKSKAIANINDSAISLISEKGPDTVYIKLKANCPQVTITDIDKNKYRVQGFIIGIVLAFGFILFLLTYIRHK